jgi:acyl-CoA synthetase (AMP-forming)/AMP-acid ligase II
VTAGLAAALAARAGDGLPALSVDGDTWLTAAQLLDAARQRADRLPGGPAVAVGEPNPLAMVVAILAAQAAGRTPVVADPAWPDADVRRVVEAVSARVRGPGAPPGLLAVVTSGSTGSPRTVLRTVDSWQASVAPFGAVTGTTPQDVAWAPGALWSTLTLWAVWHALVTGAPVVASGRWRRGAATWRAGRAATVLHAVPPVLADVLDARTSGELPRLRGAVVAGAAVPGDLRRRAAGAGVRLVEYYGAAELSFVAVDPDGHGLRPFPGVEVRVRGGRVEVRSPYLALGYVGGDEGGPSPRDPDGWAGVGDRGGLSSDGVLTLLGRGDDAVSVGGHVVATGDVERVLSAVPGVVEVACLGEPDGRLGERLLAVVRPTAGGDPRAALRAAARAGLPPPARPSRYVLMADLPRTPGGKVARAALRDLLARRPG